MVLVRLQCLMAFTLSRHACHANCPCCCRSTHQTCCAPAAAAVHVHVQGTLNRLCEERGAAQQAMRQHSQWLQGFREQVAQVAALQPAVVSKLQAQRVVVPRSSSAGPAAVQPATAAGEAGAGPGSAAGLSPVASVGSLGLDHPLTVDLGTEQLVLSLVHKGGGAGGGGGGPLS